MISKSGKFSGKPLILDNSPIEFVITGPLRGRDQVLLKSPKAGLDLLAKASEFYEEPPDRRPPRDLLELLLGSFGKFGRPQLNVVESLPLIEDVDPRHDPRKSKLRFAWKGYATAFGVSRVHDYFSRTTPELHRAIRLRERSDIDWALAPVIQACIEAEEPRIRFRRVFSTGLIVYTALIILLFSALLFREVMKQK